VSLEGNGVLDVGVRPVRTAVHHQWQTPGADLLQEPQVVFIVQLILCGETLVQNSIHVKSRGEKINLKNLGVRRDEQVFPGVGPRADLQLADLRVVRPAPHVSLAENVRFESGRATHLTLPRHDAVCLFGEQRHLRQVGAAQKNGTFRFIFSVIPKTIYNIINLLKNCEVWRPNIGVRNSEVRSLSILGCVPLEISIFPIL